MSNEPLLTWSSYPAVENPRTTLLVSIFLIFIGVILWTIFKNTPLYYVLGVLMLFIGIIPYFVETKYSFFEDHLLVNYPLVKIEKKYEEYGCFYFDKKGVMLSTFKSPRRLDAFRGQSVRLSKSQAEREELHKLLLEKIGKEC